MIGQKNLINTINSQIEDNTFPQFAIFVGEVGCGKKTLMNELANNWRFSYTCDDVKVDTLRKMMEFCYKTSSTERCVYIIPDAQKMSLQAKNSILKIVEEPPKSATFLMSVDSLSNILGTIKSRGRVYELEPYTSKELKTAVACQDALDCNFIIRVSNTIADVEKLNTIDLDALRKHITAIMNKADVLSYGNLIKSGQQIALKDEEDKIDLRLYFQAYMEECLARIKHDDEPELYRDMVIETSSRLNDLRWKGINKSMLYSNWLLNIRGIREKYGHIESKE